MKDKKKFWLIFSVAAVVLFVWMIRYKAINQDYRQRWSANTEKTYSVGEIVPIAPDFVGYNLAAEGYSLNKVFLIIPHLFRQKKPVTQR